MKPKLTLGSTIEGYLIVDEIGSGAHSYIYLVKLLDRVKQELKKGQADFHNLKQSSLFALKTIKKNQFSYEYESKILSELEHPNILSLVDKFQDQKYVYIVLDYAELGDLKQWVKQNYIEKTIPQEVAISWLCQLCLGLHHLHEGKIIHRDIKMSNVLVKKNGILKLADFGIAKPIQADDLFEYTQAGTPYYLSPEAIISSKWNTKSDIWGLGCIFYELCTGERPFLGSSIAQLMKSITEHPFKTIFLQENYSPWLVELISSMLHKNSQKRPSIISILEQTQIKQAFSQLKKKYPEYKNLKYPLSYLRTKKYLQRDDKVHENMKIYVDSLKTAKNQKNIKVQIQIEEKAPKDQSLFSSKITLNEKKVKVEREKFVHKSLRTLINKSKNDKNCRKQEDSKSTLQQPTVRKKILSLQLSCEQ